MDLISRILDFQCEGVNIQISLTLKTLDPSGDEPGGGGSFSFGTGVLTSSNFLTPQIIRSNFFKRCQIITFSFWATQMIQTNEFMRTYHIMGTYHTHIRLQ